MSLNALIAQGPRPLQLEDPVNQLAKVMQIQAGQRQAQLGDMQMAEYGEKRGRERGLRDLLAGGADSAALLRAGYITEAGALDKSRRENAAADTANKKSQSDLADARMKQSRQLLASVTTPEQYIAWHEGNHKDDVLGPMLASRGITADSARASITQALQQPGGFEDLLKKSALGLDEFIKLNAPKVVTQNLGGTSRLVATPGLGGAPQVLSDTPITRSPDSVAAQETARRGQDLTNARGIDSNRIKAAEVAMGGKPPPGYRWNGPNLEAIPGGPGDKLPESQQKQVVGVNNLSNAITEYRAELKNFSKFDTLSPDARAAMGTKYNNMMLQAKEAYNLGVLNGPDLQILTSVITDPRSFKGAITSNKALDGQASELDRIMQQIGNTSGQSRQPQNRPGAPATQPKTVNFGDLK